jgi:alpha-D-ribose 1-methylphosphonate 5-triphosphate synthase subunit PhnL
MLQLLPLSAQAQELVLVQELALEWVQQLVRQLAQVQALVLVLEQELHQRRPQRR